MTTPCILRTLLVLQLLSNTFTVQSLDDNATAVQYKFFDDKYNLTDEKDVQIRGNKSLIVFVHGFRCGTRTPAIVDFGKSLARLTDSSNVAMVDWSEWTQKMEYSDVVFQLSAVSAYLANWLNGLRERGVIESFDDVTLIGHSLGAHLIGYVGHRSNGAFRRIIALDPAQPNFIAGKKTERVDVNSGQFVMVLHTSTTFLGLRDPVGHVDFYFNGGQLQPSCLLDIVCGHLLVLNYMVDSLKNSSEFTAYRCCTVDDCEKKIVDKNQPAINMNMNVPMSTRGLYSVITEKKKLKIYSRFLSR